MGKMADIYYLGRKYVNIICLVYLLCLAGCEDTDVMMVTGAGIDAVKALTLSDEAVQKLAKQAVEFSDGKNKIAGVGDRYGQRLQSLVGPHLLEGDLRFNFKVYLSEQVNAFAMADGTIRIYSGLMDMLDDGELLFVIGHEMGHVAKDHIRKKMQLAYAASAVRKGISSQNNTVGDVARSQLGGFAELLMNAQFSQLEEKEADDYGLSFLSSNGYDQKGAVSALKKLATLGDNHSFLASHPAPGQRAKRLEHQLAGETVPIEENKQSLVNKAIAHVEQGFSIIYEKLSDFLSWLNKREGKEV